MPDDHDHDGDSESQLIEILREQLAGQRRLIMMLSGLLALLLSATIGGGIYFKFWGFEGGSELIPEATVEVVEPGAAGADYDVEPPTELHLDTGIVFTPGADSVDP